MHLPVPLGIQLLGACWLAAAAVHLYVWISVYSNCLSTWRCGSCMPATLLLMPCVCLAEAPELSTLLHAVPPGSQSHICRMRIL